MLYSAALWSKSVEEYHRSFCAPHLIKQPHVLVVWYYLSYHFLFWKCNKIILQQISFCFLTTDTCLVFIASAHSLLAYHCGGFHHTLSWNRFTLYGCEVRIRRYMFKHRKLIEKSLGNVSSCISQLPPLRGRFHLTKNSKIKLFFLLRLHLHKTLKVLIINRTFQVLYCFYYKQGGKPLNHSLLSQHQH